ncbi:hypothetical protein HO133_008015 [Letharia lupina]|uniref:BTB domain-containing protein n=1 Tax=Letharia lupina TaxID=560253 RepID=A0A8H6CR07_9LECA|nr:uncharacterized protein HO133_008015 [Letharia lupina]KAF6228285.1 hypothetical protein HO133_008015 [Letharia lupina]
MAPPVPMYHFGNPSSFPRPFVNLAQQSHPLPQPQAAVVVPTPRSTNVDDVRSQDGLQLLRNPTSVLVTVGNTKAATTWSIPKNLLTHHSAFFNTIVQDNKVALPEDDPDTFELLVQWLYAGGLNTVATRSEPYVKAWILGDKLKCLTFRDHAMLQILHCHKRGDFPEQPISPESVRLAFGQTQPESKLHLGTMSGRSEVWVPVLEEMPDLEKETARALMRSGERGIQNPYTQGQKYLEVLKHADFCDPL